MKIGALLPRARLGTEEQFTMPQQRADASCAFSIAASRVVLHPRAPLLLSATPADARHRTRRARSRDVTL